ncbi:MAG TPA: ABC transporter substrate-binding protein [Acidimicrobiales bacterium]|jgi:osmoprotectant transport system substrate-binding protein|nr:ABC transporter substrate-binding protein [Acidimicrobiales bacterium]
MKRIRLIAALAALALVAAACGDDDDDSTAGDDATAGDDGAAGDLSGQSLTVGSANFPENVLLAEMYAGALEAAGAEVTVEPNIGSREVYYPAIETGEIDLLPEYTNSLLSFVLRQDDPEATPEASNVEEQLTELEEVLPENLTVLTPSSAEDKDVIVCNQETIDEFGFSDLSGLAEVSGEITLGAPPEFAERSPFGIPGFQEFYGAEFGEFVPLEIGPPIVDALNAGAIDCGNLFSTDAAITENDFTALEDDMNIVPNEAVLPLISVEKATPEVTAVLDDVNAALDTEGLTDLNFEVQAEGLAEAEVAEQWLADNGFTE